MNYTTQVHVGVKMVLVGILVLCMCYIFAFVPSYCSTVYKNGLLLHITDVCDGEFNYCFE